MINSDFDRNDVIWVGMRMMETMMVRGDREHDSDVRYIVDGEVWTSVV